MGNCQTLGKSNSDLKEARNRGENIYDNLVNGIFELPEPVRENAAKVLGNLWLKEQEIINEMQSVPKADGQNSTVNIGTNVTFDRHNDGAQSASKWGFGLFTATSNQQNIKTCRLWGMADGIGGGSGWAWSGRRVSFSGTSPRLARITFGIYDRYLLSAFNSSINYNVKLEVWDTTGSSTRIAARTIINESATHSLKDLTFDRSEGLDVTLEPGRQYVFRVLVEGSANSYAGAALGNLNSRSDAIQYHNYWTTIAIRWM